MRSASLQVPVDDRLHLTELSAALGLVADDTSLTHPFDGELMAQLLIPLSAATISVLKRWIDARVQARESYRVYIDGVEFTGYSAPEMVRLFKTLDEAG